ncbi:MAG TPA: hypothetical protein VLG12_01760 [Candidatus Saccharimonadales bacterium]|nr:hypothetical protein [Candidatus Saccharimonadales bacterium]
MKIYNIAASLIIFIIVAIVYKIIFFPVSISGGDYISYTSPIIQSLFLHAFAVWDNKLGLGSSTLPLMHYAPYNFLIGLIGTLCNNVILTERFLWWIPFLSLSAFSTFTLYRFIFPKNMFWPFGVFIFLCNTYILMLVSGGQIAGIGLAYAIAPLIFYFFMKTGEFIGTKSITSLLRSSLFAGLLFSLSVMFDIRIAYITLAGIALYWLFYVTAHKVYSLKYLSCSLLYTFIIPFLVTGLLHIFWILPILLFKINPTAQFGIAYTGSSSASFFSFATFENTLSLLHPNWPENIFGKVYFMRPEFLLLPIIAFSSLLYIRKDTIGSKRESFFVLFFGFLLIIAAFLAKGTNLPFGNIYSWLFSHVPGFVMFRDATKWYLLIAIAYSMLLPFAISKIYQHFNKKFPAVSSAFLVFSIVYFLFLIRPALFNQIGGTFNPTSIPSEYTKLNSRLSADKQFSRVLWIPVPQRYGFFSETHPEVSAEDLFQTASLSGVLQVLQKPSTEQLIQDAGIKYIIVPDDVRKELFMKDSHYDASQYTKAVRTTSLLSWLSKPTYVGKIAVFIVKYPKDHFWIAGNTSANITYTYNNPTSYTVVLKNAKKDEKLVFSETFNPHWVAKISDKTSSSNMYEKHFNSFTLPKSGDYTVNILFQPQSLSTGGLWVSCLSFLGIIIFVILSKVKR